MTSGKGSMNLTVLSHQRIIEKRRWWILLGAVVLGVMGVAAWRGLPFQGQREDSVDVAVLPEITTVTALGRLEPE